LRDFELRDSGIKTRLGERNYELRILKLFQIDGEQEAKIPPDARNSEKFCSINRKEQVTRKERQARRGVFAVKILARP
jgi:hypothetical protein